MKHELLEKNYLQFKRFVINKLLELNPNVKENELIKNKSIEQLLDLLKKSELEAVIEITVS